MKNPLFSACQRLLPLCCLLLSLAGCVAPSAPSSVTDGLQGGEGQLENMARLTVFFHLKNQQGPDIEMRVSRIELLREGGALPLAMATTPLELRSGSLASRQTLLAGQTVAPATYTGLRFVLEGAALHTGGQTLMLALDAATVTVPLDSPLRLHKGESLCLFVSWDPASSLLNKALLAPALSATVQADTLLADRVFVACPQIDTVFMVRTDRNWVTGAIGVPGGPTYLASDSSANRLYVLASQQNAIRVFDQESGKLLDSIHIPLTRSPGFMVTSPDYSYAYVLDSGNSFLLRISLSSGTLTHRVRIGNRPRFLAYLAGHDRLAVASSLSQNVILVDPATLESLETIPVGGPPHGVAESGDLLYISESAANTVLVYDLNARQIRYRVQVGTAPWRLLYDGSHIYVANRHPGGISLLQPGQRSMTQQIPLPGATPLEMTYAPSRRWLYIGDQEGKRLIVVDQTSKEVIQDIQLGAAPLGLALLE